MNNIPKVTVILTSFNHSKYLREAIDSVLFQTYNNYELIIWDDASTDDSWQIIESYTDSRIRAFKNSVTIGGGNINRALKQSKGEYIAIHHSDDIWELSKLEKQVDFLNKNQDIGAVFTNAHIIGEEGVPFVDESHFYYKIFDQPNRTRHEWLRYFFEKGNALCHPSVLIRKQCYMDCGFYRYGFAQLTDFDMWVRLALRYDIHVLPEKLVRFRVRAAEANASGNRPDTRSREAYEYSLTLNHYLKIDRLDDLIKVFPEARKFCDGQHPNLKYALAMTAIEIRPRHLTIPFALNLLSEILNHSTESSLTPFNSQDFIKLTGELDPVRVCEFEKYNQVVTERDRQIAELSKVVTERDRQIAELSKQIAELSKVVTERDRQIDEIYRSNSWRLSAPLRYFGRQRQRLLLLRVLPVIRNKAAWLLPLFRYTLNVRCAKFFRDVYSKIINLYKNDQFINEKKDKKYLHICFYLPQFHEIEENNKFWGKGFTEWTNVKKAKTLFEGHDQPKHPHKSLGYYNLSDKESLVKQVNLAKRYGIDAFSYYLYLFDKDRSLLDTPLKVLLNNLDIDQKFCICWANENWTRTWDGKNKDVLIEQMYSEELLNFFPEYIEKYISDKRYVRDHNRPLILIYRPEKIPNISYWSNQWRNYFRKKLNIEILLCKVNSFTNQCATDINFDLNIEFPPNLSLPNKVKNNIYPKTLNTFDYNVFLNEEYHIQQNQKLLIRSTFPSWDNTPRRQENGTVFINANPAKFYQYIELCKKFRSDIERLDNNYLFINSWNEWAEGAQIEPDNTNGFNNLISNKISKKDQKKILFFIHDLHPHGTQYQTLAMAKFYKKYGYSVEVITFENGKLEEIFRENVDTIDILDLKNTSKSQQFVKNFVNDYNLIIYASLAATKLIGNLEYNNQIVLINELPKIIEEYSLQNDLQNTYKNAYKIYYPALFNKNFVENHFNIKKNNNNQIIIQQQGLLKINNFINKTKNECFEIFKEKYFELARDKKIIINIGFGDHRKGFDIFYKSSQLKKNQNYFFLWIGNTNLPFKNNDNFKLIDHTFDVGLFYKIADLFFLSSREDPFPNVINEASDSDLKILAFDGATGAGEFIKENNGCLITFSEQVVLDKINFINLNEDFTQRKSTIDNLCQNILSNVTDFKKVSVIVPNYNHEKFIEQRLKSIYQQDYPIHEIIFLDDCSLDRSLNHAYKSLRANKIKYKIIENNTNDGKVFHQWKKGILEATGDLCWIAESDDLSETNFLSETVKGFSYDDVVLSYSSSKICNENGTITSNDYQFYLKKFHQDKWRYNYLENGNNEISNYLIHQNHIMNVSSCIFDLNHAKQIIHDDTFEKTSNYFTDWLFYIYLVKNKKIYYNSKNLNIHRRHKESIFGRKTNDIEFNLNLKHFKLNIEEYLSDI